MVSGSVRVQSELPFPHSRASYILQLVRVAPMARRPRGAPLPVSFARRQSGLQRQPGVWRTPASRLVALLSLPCVLAAVPAYEAHGAARPHRVTRERALRDYATFAAWDLLPNATDTIGPTLSAAL